MHNQVMCDNQRYCDNTQKLNSGLPWRLLFYSHFPSITTVTSPTFEHLFRWKYTTAH